MGCFLHPIFVQDANTALALGISDAQLWSRNHTRKRDKSRRYETKDIHIEKKESYKWLGPCLKSRDTSLSTASSILFIMDREGDIMEVYDRLPNARTDVLVRVMHNRSVLDQSGKKERLYDYINTLPVKGKSIIEVKGKKRKPRKARATIKYGSCTLQWPRGQKVKYKNNPSGVEVSVIEIKEGKHKGYKNEPPLIWRLITTKKITSLKEAQVQIDNYAQRWNIEQYFKFLKSDGYDIEATELSSGLTIRKLILIIMKSSIKVMQLKAARKGTKEKITSIFNEEEIYCLQQLNKRYEGSTEKQRNPHDPSSLAWASWVIARMGGWKEFYDKSRPPGNKTFAWGLEKFENVMLAFNILKNKDVS